MKLDAQPFIHSAEVSSNLLDPIDVINTMIDLRAQLAQLEQQVQALQPAFYTACTALNTDKIELERAIISRRLSPAQWTYTADILQQEALFKALRKQFQQDHEPTGGRDITWVIKLLLAQCT